MKKKNNNGIFYIAISLLAVLAVGSGVAAYAVSQNVNVNGDYNYYESEGQPAPEGELIGAFAGPDIYADVNIFGTLITGSGSVNATTTDAATYTLVARDIQTYSYLDLDYTDGAAITITMPATSTMNSILPLIGSNRTWTIHNASTTGAMTLAAGAGTNLLGVDANVDTIAADGWAELTCMKIVYADETNENFACLMTEYVVAD